MFTVELCLIVKDIDAKFEGKLACAFINDMRNLEFSQAEKYQFHFRK